MSLLAQAVRLRYVNIRFWVFALLLVVALVAAGAREGASANSRKLYVVPLGHFPRSSLAELRHYAERRFGLASTLRPALAAPDSTFDRSRQQFTAERLIQFVSAKERAAITGQGSLVLIFTREDIYSSRRSDLRYVFTNRAAGTYGVISIKRMNPTYFGLPPDQRLLKRRLHKIIARDVGFLTAHGPSSNWRSALYAHLDSVDDLDGMTDELQPRQTAAESRWVRGAGRVCSRADRLTQAAARRTKPAPTAPPRELRQAFLRFLSQAIPVEARALTGLRALRHPARRRPLNRELLALFASEVDLDQRNLRRLSRKWDGQLVQTWLRQSQVFGLRLKGLGLELGSRGCARYFSPH
jgi:predicted Zn-dependent protease